jgi:hypothetical protein
LHRRSATIMELRTVVLYVMLPFQVD